MQEDNLFDTDPEESVRKNWDDDLDLTTESTLPDYQHTPSAPTTAIPKEDEEQDQDLSQMI